MVSRQAPRIARQTRPAQTAPPAVDPQRVLANRVAAVELDNVWRARFDEQIASYRQANARIAGALDAAHRGFQGAQVAQAQIDALQTQLIGAVVAIGVALTFEWAFTAALGVLGVAAGRIERAIEAVENPVNAAVSSGVNIQGVRTATQSTNQGGTPALGNSAGAAGATPMAFFAHNSEALDRHGQAIAQAFRVHGERRQAFTDAQWMAWTRDAEQARYQALLAELGRSGAGVERLRGAAELAAVLEKHLWALWIEGRRESELSNQDEIDAARREGDEGEIVNGGAFPSVETDPERGVGPEGSIARRLPPSYTLGSAIEVRLNQLGIASQAGVTLTGSVMTPNQPGRWRQLLYAWARQYRGTLAQ
jgi:hypothetical protein